MSTFWFRSLCAKYTTFCSQFERSENLQQNSRETRKIKKKIIFTKHPFPKPPWNTETQRKWVCPGTMREVNYVLSAENKHMRENT